MAKIRSRITVDRVMTVLAALLIAVILICAVIIVVTLLRQYPSRSWPSYPTTHFSAPPAPRPSPYYKNCGEAHADGRWDIPLGDPAYRPALDKDRNGIACESPKQRRGWVR
ncbi:excalibur calcium-binding domain-containing protein [Mycobacterium kyorinense]|uniref:excalibur calcium-binding domain-containing protein n=1 Tax=Mycobacterium kyorinense TaxID=487514 RepID=UPI003F6CE81C